MWAIAMVHKLCIITNMSTPKAIANRVGRQKIQAAVGAKSPTAVTNAIRRGTFPPGWYLVVKELCENEGIDCPYSAFGMIDPKESAA